MSLDEHFPPGALVGNYEVLTKLGQGGMGGVFLVRQVFLKKRFALKVLNDELAAMPEYVDIFRHEARMLAALKHPHIVQIHDFGMAGERNYFVMDYVDGGSLDEFRRTRGGSLSPEEALSVLRSIVSSLAHAHALGIVHRDLKPENFLLDHDGVVKITDFGLARLAHDPGTKVAEKKTHGDTYAHFAEQAQATPELTGGTEGFIAPEVKAGGCGDARSDVYAIGVIARLLLTGHVAEVGMKSLSKSHPELGDKWDRVIDRCLCADPADRYADGAALEKDLEALAGTSEKASHRPPAWVWAMPVPVLALTVFAAVLALREPRRRTGRDDLRPPEPQVAVMIPRLSAKDIREYGLKAADAELGYALWCDGTPGRKAVAGWRVGSRAVWRREVEPGRYRLAAIYHYTSELGAKPVRLAVRAGKASLSIYLPVTANDEGARAILGDIEVPAAASTVEAELVEGPADQAHLRLVLLVLEPLTSGRVS